MKKFQNYRKSGRNRSEYLVFLLVEYRHCLDCVSQLVCSRHLRLLTDHRHTKIHFVLQLKAYGSIKKN